MRRAYRNGRIKHPKTAASYRAVPLQAIALDALDALPTRTGSALLFPAPRGGYLDLHNFRYRDWKPAQRDLAIDPIRRVYDLRHTFATFALRAGISTFDLSRYMGASLTMIDRHYGHLAKDGRQHAIDLLDSFNSSRVHTVDAKWTRQGVTPNDRAEKPPRSRTNARALCRTRTDDPFLTMEGRGCFERSRALTSGHEMPANR